MSESRWRGLLVEPARPDAIRNRPIAPWLAVGTVCIGAFMGQLDASIVTLAFPTLERSFHATLSAVQWVGLTYLLTLVGLVAAFGRLADMLGRKLLYTYGFGVFIVGSALCAVAPGLVVLDGFRVVQGVGAAMLQANSVAIIAASVPSDRLGRAVGLQGTAQALGLSLGPAVGGVLIGVAGWRLIFLINVPLGLVGIVLGWYLIPRSRHLSERARFDWLGLVILLPAVCLALLALSFGNEQGWTAPTTVGELVGALGLTAAFVARERRAPGPMIDLSLFARRAFSAGVGSGFLSYLVMFGVLFMFPFFMENVRHLSAAVTGAELTVMPLALALVAPLAGRLADHVGARPLTTAGMALTSAALALVAVFHADGRALVGELAAIGAGLGLFTPPNNAAIMGAAPLSQAGVASGVLNLTRGLGTSVGLAATAAVLASVAGSRLVDPGRTAHAFGVAAVFLAVVSGVALGVAVARPGVGLSGPTGDS